MSLVLERVTVRRSGRAILSDFSLELRGGEVLAIVGPNGAGKSTALGAAAGTTHPDTGRVLLNGRSIYRIPAVHLARERAVVMQGTQIAFPFRVHEVVALGRAPHRGWSAAQEDAAVVEDMLHRFDLHALADRDVTTLSGGERQRVHLARAFAQLGSAADQTGKWLLLDEPTAALDLAHQLAALGASRQFARAGGGVLAVLHDLRLACRYADRVAVLRSGRIAASGAPAEALSLSCVRDVYGLEEDSLDLFLDVTRPCARRAKCDAPMPDHARQVEPAGSGR